MERRILWLAAVLIGALALVAGCIKVDVPQGPYVTLRENPRPVSPEEQTRIRALDKPALENEVLRLVGENDSLRQEVERLKRDNKMLKDERERLKDQVKDLRKR